MTRHGNGFTLLEVMIALLIFGMIAAAGVAILSFSVRAQGASATRLDQVSALNRTAAIMTADLAQALDRPTRDAAGATLPAFVGESGGDAAPMLRLVRAGWSNPDALARPGAQKVEYALQNGALVRIAYPQLDGAAPLPPAVLLPHVAGATLRYRYAGAWSDRWDGATGIALPQAAELTLRFADGTSLRQLFLIGTGYAAPPPPAAGAAPATNAIPSRAAA